MVLRGPLRRTVSALCVGALGIAFSAGCAGGAKDATSQSASSKRAKSKLVTAGTVHVPGGKFLMGSTIDERAVALELAYAGHGRVIPEASAWLKYEYRQKAVDVPEFWIMEHPVTQHEYLDYVRATGAPEPFVDLATWNRQGLRSPYESVKRAAWLRGAPKPDREQHPVVMVSQPQAATYCAWWGAQREGVGRLPSEQQWEKAARGEDGRAYPWGPNYEPSRLNAADAGPGDTVEVGLFESGASPYGALDMAGNVFEWTRTRDYTDTASSMYVVKGGAFTTYGHANRAAARHFRPAELRHTIIGFRCVLEPKPAKKNGSTKKD